jgi:hypothetical protein
MSSAAAKPIAAAAGSAVLVGALGALTTKQ